MTRVAFITQWFAPEPTIVPDAIAVALRNAGAQVEVLTGIPNYPTGVVHSGYRAGEARSDDVNGFRVRRTPLFPSHDGSAARRIANYLSWALSSAVFGIGVLRRAQVNIVYGSPITAATPALLARLIAGRPFILIVQDVWPDSVFATGFLQKGLVSRAALVGLTWFTNRVYSRASKIVVISPGMRSLLAARGVDPDKIEVVYNWVPSFAAEGDSASRERLREELGIDPEHFVLMYGGNHGPAQALGPVIEAVTSLSEDKNCHLVMVGEGVDKDRLQQLASKATLRRVHFLGQQPAIRMQSLMAAADAQLVSLADDTLFAITVPSKLQSILSAGHPLIAVASGDVARIVEGAKAGLVVRPGDVDSLAAAVAVLAAMDPVRRRLLGESGNRMYEAEMSERVGTLKWRTMLEELRKQDG